MSAHPSGAILLVDDEPSVLGALERLLRQDFRITAVPSLAEARAALSKTTFEVAVIDLNLKDGHSLDLFRELKRSHPATTRVLISGDLQVESLAKNLETSLIHKILLKPWDPKALVLQIKEAVQIHRLLKEREHLEQISSTDAMTGLFNYRYLQGFLPREIERAKRQNRPLSLVMLDIDGFKSWNDTHGHPKGDEVLRKIADLIRDSVRTFDCLCRYGGDEFCILLQETDLARAAEIAERVRLKAAQESPLTLSLGISSFPAPSGSATSLINDADQALYTAKNQGRNRCVIAGAKPSR